MSQTTLVILKPDCVSRGIVGQITQRFENTGLKLVGAKMVNLSREILDEHYSHIVDKPFYPSTADYMQSGPVIIQLWSGTNAVAVVRKNIGVTNPLEARAGTIRADFALSIDENVIHASEDDEQAAAEIKRFFNESEICA